ncbi:MAG: glycosyltransferase family 4 protein [Candidatus Mcinerneyibacterium aminivorans]|uniref:Glycosyltransferase family 4 protein n=1 Tax=Candidatus Mcinerneyibacterium aminivorans TaxID=2703815 RepID=A0A5D0MA39_9BACT|nr:MAG: glycosyltransferase family 4 protein [Candidatus Mcinerneyibacterium aminivorans]
MKVLVIPFDYPTTDNPFKGIFVKKQVKALSEYVDISVYKLRRLPLRNPINIIKKKKCELVYDDNVLTLDCCYLNKIPKISFLKNKIYKRKLFKNFDKLKSNFGKPDIIHAHMTYPAGYEAMLIGQKYNIPFLVTEHSSDFEKMVYVNHPKKTAKVLSTASSYIAVSSMLKRKIQDAGKMDCKIIPNFVNIEKFDLKETVNKKWQYSDKFNIINISLMSEKKGIDYLLKAFKKVIDKRGKENIHLHLVGDGPKKKDYEKLSVCLGIRDSCSFHGFLKSEDVAKILNKCNALVISSKVETFGIVGIEAMAAGLPVVSTSCGGPEDYINKDNGVLVESENTKSLTSGIIKIMKNYENYDKKYIKNYVKNNYSSKVVCDIIIDNYKKIIKQKNKY